MIRLTFPDKGTYKGTRIEPFKDLRTNFKPTEVLITPTFNRSCNPIRVEQGFSN